MFKPGRGFDSSVKNCKFYLEDTCKHTNHTYFTSRSSKFFLSYFLIAFTLGAAQALETNVSYEEGRDAVGSCPLKIKKKLCSSSKLFTDL